MTKTITRRAALAGAAVAPAALAAPAIARAQTAVRWRMQALWPSGTPNFQSFERFAANVAAMSGGRLEIETLPVGAVVAYNESADAVAAGILDAHYSAPSYFSGREPGLGLLGDLNGGFDDPYDVQMWMEYGGGLELAREVYADWGIQFVAGIAYGVEALTSKRPIRTLEDFNGLRIRSPEGVLGAIFRALGAGVVNLAGSEIFTALETNVIDATDWNTLANNEAQGFFEIAKFSNYPGFHSCGNLDVAVNQRRWDELTDDMKAIVTIAARDFTRDSIQSNTLADEEAATRARAQGVELIDLSPEERRRFREVSQVEWRTWAERSPMAKRILDSQEAFLRRINKL